MKRPSAPVLALVVVLLLAVSGTSYAAGKAQAGDRLITKTSLSGNRLKNDTVTGKQVKEATLATVPRATLADRVPRPVYLEFTDITAGWQDSGIGTREARYGIDVSGTVHLSGGFSRAAAGNGVVATLPVG